MTRTESASEFLGKASRAVGEDEEEEEEDSSAIFASNPTNSRVSSKRSFFCIALSFPGPPVTPTPSLTVPRGASRCSALTGSDWADTFHSAQIPKPPGAFSKMAGQSYGCILRPKKQEDPFILPHQQVDKGAIKFVLSGANIMCPGLTSPGAKLYPAVVDTIVAIMAEGKQHALCVGVMKMSAEDIEKVNKGIGIENIHYLNDGLWHMKTYK
ncbi:malignant T-cell-amplified sequence 1 [Enhydra lutris kenyoni]|uniref:Malignant T-cell-amplified sequence 1 n=1 Tax=Enhydra lutris kenyoni TaxID=391180 RepID=A0A2Y9KK14_ENHLU|nr:malignant T-cell-amplified sequence 1 [Enhydra lutris kenyoni]